jgi:hypothetical protein
MDGEYLLIFFPNTRMLNFFTAMSKHKRCKYIIYVFRHDIILEKVLYFGNRIYSAWGSLLHVSFLNAAIDMKQKHVFFLIKFSCCLRCPASSKLKINTKNDGHASFIPCRLLNFLLQVSALC